MDQAEKLRDYFQDVRYKTVETLSAYDDSVYTDSIGARVITVSSGKGGVGKTNLVVNLAIYLGNIGQRIMIVDADFGLANIEVLLGIIPKYSLSDVFNGRMTVEDIITNGPLGVKFISGGSGFRDIANLSDMQMKYIIESFFFLDKISDLILIDTGAGISNQVINFIKASNETVIVTTPEPTSIMDAYALIKMIAEDKDNMPEIKIVVNKADDKDEGDAVFGKLDRVAGKFLDLNLVNLGFIPNDNNLVRAVKNQQPAIVSFPNAAFSKSVRLIGQRLTKNIDNNNFYNNSNISKIENIDSSGSFIRKLAGYIRRVKNK